MQTRSNALATCMADGWLCALQLFVWPTTSSRAGAGARHWLKALCAASAGWSDALSPVSTIQLLTCTFESATSRPMWRERQRRSKAYIVKWTHYRPLHSSSYKLCLLFLILVLPLLIYTRQLIRSYSIVRNRVRIGSLGTGNVRTSDIELGSKSLNHSIEMRFFFYK